MGTFDEDFEWQQQFRDHFTEIALKALRVDVSSMEDDWRRNTDFMLSTVVRMPKRDLRISARARRHKYLTRYRDNFTIRLDRPSGREAEMPKIRAGWGDLTIYGFAEQGDDTGRLGTWFLGNVAMLRDYLAGGGYYEVQQNLDRSSRLAAVYHADMPLGFVLDSEALPAWDHQRVWETCRKCWWWKSSGGVVAPCGDDWRPGDGYNRRCLACGFKWRAGWVMSLTRTRQNVGGAA